MQTKDSSLVGQEHGCHKSHDGGMHKFCWVASIKHPANSSETELRSPAGPEHLKELLLKY